jgi:hypothetical protein
MQDARNAILNEIREVTSRNPGISPQMIVNKINEVENSYGHRHNDVQLVQQRDPRTGQPYLDVAPLQNYGRSYQQGEYQSPEYAPPPPGYAPPPPGYYSGQQPPVVYEPQPQVNPVLPLAIGIGLGAILSGHRR